MWAIFSLSVVLRVKTLIWGTDFNLRRQGCGTWLQNHGELPKPFWRALEPLVGIPRGTQLIACRAVSWGHGSQIDARLLLHECPGCVGGRIAGTGQSGAGASAPQPPTHRASWLIAKRRQPKKVPLQAAEMAVIYSHLYLTDFKGKWKDREAAGCWSNLTVTEIKGNRMWCHIPHFQASRSTEILEWKGCTGRKHILQEAGACRGVPRGPLQPSPAQPLGGSLRSSGSLHSDISEIPPADDQG